MANQIDVRPQVLDLFLYAGDGVKFRIICTDGAGAPVDITGEVKAQIRLKRFDPDPPIESFSVNSIDSYKGIVILELTGAQTAHLSQDPSNQAGNFKGVWDIQWTPAGSQPRTLCQGKAECVIDVTR
jgi:hypothetical protein